MPTYDFECKKCKKRFSKKASLAEKDQIKCPGCESGDLKQLIGNSFFTNLKKSCSPPQGGYFG
ncbi:MAG: zinc ribbon domain-containing protein [Candidatus Syntrophonatronum acetioxidans]|uniref:Zinc ribbon domain-containing protein n=1 Tax=Candidatus Syntrophonatronum acetioxidans TaxID=1795816 RepID=A0A424YEV8_9FIRM|nr:MAG: zinc ribbon domain-containing protein [Candidatus Syntrophonatronum acetioxidans]